ncbi:hypothetical protein GOODEAATRI_015656 [Goodea atripinnis]|uniref:Uncharacterized protein n=1 Tax=Goodea atripinnis TaxID=208336 RepID=A0ABV0P4F4_9TELE
MRNVRKNSKIYSLSERSVMASRIGFFFLQTTLTLPDTKLRPLRAYWLGVQRGCIKLRFYWITKTPITFNSVQLKQIKPGASSAEFKHLRAELRPKFSIFSTAEILETHF